MNNVKITIEATIAAPVEKVWIFWTDPKHITQWNFADESWQCPWATNELKIGGKFCARMEAKDGSFGFEFTGTYDEVIPNNCLSYTMEDGRQVTTTFQSVGLKSKVVTKFDAEKENPVEMQKSGWQAILNNFKKHAESAQLTKK